MVTKTIKPYICSIPDKRVVRALDMVFNYNMSVIDVDLQFTATDATRLVAICTRPMRLDAVSSAFGTASTSGTWTVERLIGTTAPGSGIVLLKAPVALSGAANTVANGALISPSTTLEFATGDRIGIVIAGTMTNLVGAIGVIMLTPL